MIALYRVVRGGRWKKSYDVGLVPSSSSFELIFPHCLATVRCKSASDPGSHRAWVDWCLWSLPGPGSLTVLLISILDALRPSFEDNSVSELVVFCRVVARSTWSFLKLGSACALCCCLAHCSTEFVGSCMIYNLMYFVGICNKKSLFLHWYHLFLFLLLLSMVRLFMKYSCSLEAYCNVSCESCGCRVLSKLCNLYYFVDGVAWMDKSWICSVHYTVVNSCFTRHFSCVSYGRKRTVAFPCHVKWAWWVAFLSL
jgi:hypothetical protein